MTLHFTLKEDGIHYFIDLEKKETVRVSNQEEVRAWIYNYFQFNWTTTKLTIDSIYTLEGEYRVEIRQQVEITFDDGKEWMDCRK